MKQASPRGLLGRLQLIQAAIFASLVGGGVMTLIDQPPDRRWTLGLWLVAAGAAAYALTLTRRVEVRQAAELDQRRQAEQAALAADRAKTAFLANMSHEIRTPMSAALGMTELLLDMDLPADTREPIQVIQSSGEALVTLIDDILDFAKIESGKIELAIAGFDLHALIDKTAQILRARADEKALRFLLRVAPEVPQWVAGDANRLRQILLNLGGNAVKFTTTGEVELCVEATGDGSRVRFQVRDTGIGIAPDEHQRIFETFVQADSSSARRSSGSGLGLSICRQLVELMAGEIGVTSEHGVGSTFWIEVSLPLASVPGALATLDDTEVRRHRAEARILVVDDHAANRTVAVSRLETMGYRAAAVASGEEALEILAERRFDAVLMDCHMPALDGYETTRRLRASESPDQHVAVIAITADALPENRRKCLEAGMDDYLAKPFRSAELAGILDRQLFAVSSSEASLNPPPDNAPEADAIAALRERGLLRSTVDELLERGEEHLAALREARDTGDLGAAAARAHALGGSAQMFGGVDVAEHCTELEALAASVGSDPDAQAPGRFEATVEDLAQAWHTFRRHLEEIRDGD